jgi:hypothetical protein
MAGDAPSPWLSTSLREQKMREPTLCLPKSRPGDQRFAATCWQPPRKPEAERSADGPAVLAAWLLFAILLAPPALSLLIAEAAAHLR